MILTLYLSMMCQRSKQDDLCSFLGSVLNSIRSLSEEEIYLIFIVIIGVNLPRLSVVLSNSKIYLGGIKTESMPGQIDRINRVIETPCVINKQMKVNMTHGERNSCH